MQQAFRKQVEIIGVYEGVDISNYSRIQRGALLAAVSGQPGGADVSGAGNYLRG